VRGVTKVGLERSTPRGAALPRGRSGLPSGAPEQSSAPSKLRALLGGSSGEEHPQGDEAYPHGPSPTMPEPGRRRQRAPWRRAPVLVLAAVGGVAAVLFGETVLTLLGAAVLGMAACDMIERLD